MKKKVNDLPPPTGPAKFQIKTPPVAAVYISAPQVCARYGGRSHMWLVRKLRRRSEIPPAGLFRPVAVLQDQRARGI